MKRIVAKEFLLLVACLMAVLSVALFGWVRNAWLSHRVESARSDNIEQSTVLDSLERKAQPVPYNYIALYDTAYVRKHYDLFMQAPAWHCGLEANSDFSRVLLACLTKVLKREEYMTEGLVTRLQKIPELSKRRTLAQIADGLPQESSSSALAAVEEEINRGRSHKRAPPMIGDVESGYRFLGGDPSVESNWAKTQQGPPRLLIKAVGYHPFFAPEIRDNAFLLDGMQDLREVTWDELILGISAAVTDTLEDTAEVLFARCVIHEPDEHAELKAAHTYLKERAVLNCAFDELLYTLQRKPVPPTQEALDALAKQRTTVDELRKEENDARASLWSEAKQWAVVKWAAIVLLVLVYPLRLLVLGTRWALRTLRS